MKKPSAIRGLTTTEAHRRLGEVGPNRLAQVDGPSALRLLLAQLESPFVVLLVGAAVLSGVLGEVVDAIAIGVILALNALVGWVQELRAERALAALARMTAPRALVLRDGERVQIAAEGVVPGDLLVLEPGAVVAADARLEEANELSTIEASLTGESLPVGKDTTVLDGAPLAERRDTVFAGTSVARGTGLAVVFATGMNTELGTIAGLLQTASSGATPLQQRLAQVSRSLLWMCLAVVGIVAVLGLLRGEPWLHVLLVAVSLAVAAVPEGLPAIVTIALAVGVQRMAARNVLVRRLAAVETLGCTTVICTDKTGTLTTGQMRVRELHADNETAMLEAAASCCDTTLTADLTVGDPTEIAVLLAARERGIDLAAIEADRPRVRVLPFDSDRKRMAIARSDGRIYVKGAASHLLPLCTTGTAGGAEADDELAARGLRVLGVAVGQGTDERNLEFLGLIGIADPPRPSAIEAVRVARRAGIRTVMITGDHPVTARSIARELGVVGPGDDPETLVHARVVPADKLRIVREFKERGEVVAMVGDGVNDAPAIREANVGVAMGRAGTEVTREAASVVITDDHFASIVEGIREGRVIYDNIHKTVLYLLAGNGAELGVVLGASLLGMPSPLLPLHLLWVNLVTDGLPALALVVDPPDQEVLERPPRDPAERILTREAWIRIGGSAAVEGIVVIGMYGMALRLGDLETARTIAFSTLVMSELLRAFAARSRSRVFFEVGAFGNMALLGVVVLSGFVQVALTHIPATRELLHLVPLSPLQWAGIMAAALVPVTTLELGKLVRRWLAR
jgi:Ca2+-transporting ATPase